MNRLLLKHPPIENDESVEGYVARISKENLINVSKLIKELKGDASQEDIDDYLSDVNNLTGQSFRKEQLLYTWYKENYTVPQWKRKGYSRYCPLCLKMSKYHRYKWSLSVSTYCFDHQVFLLGDCEKCNKKVDIGDIVNGFCNRCYFNLSDASLISSTFDVVEILNFNLSFTYLQSLLSLEEYITMLNRFSYFFGINIFKLNMSKTENYYLQHWGYLENPKKQCEINNLSIKIIEGWPSEAVYYMYKHSKIRLGSIQEHLIKSTKKIQLLNLRQMLRNSLYDFNNLGTDIKKVESLPDEREFDKYFIRYSDLFKFFSIKHRENELFEIASNYTKRHPRTNELCLNKSKIQMAKEFLKI